MNDQMNIQVNWKNDSNKNGRISQRISVILLFGIGVALGIGYLLHLAGFSGWMTLMIAGVTLFVAGALWGDIRRFAWLATAVALFGALMCTTALPAQLQAQQLAAFSVNLGIILSQVAVVIIILANRKAVLA